MKIDYLVMLLSTDWFIQFSSGLGFRFSEASQREIQAGCRDIVRELMGGAGDYYQIDLSDERQQETHRLLAGLIGAHASGKDDLNIVEEWINGPSDDFRSSVMLRMLTNDLLLGASEESIPEPDFGVRLVVKEEADVERVTMEQFWDASIVSQSTWDRYIRGLFSETPSALSDIASFAVQEHRLKQLWKRICERLTEHQVDSLINWCRAMAVSRGIPIDPIPNYLTFG